MNVIMSNSNPPSYLPYVKDHALHQQYEHIRTFYSQPPSEWFLTLPYQYLNEQSMSRMIADSIEAILIVHEKVQGQKNLMDVKSSSNLLPQALTSPYENPLGNT